MGSRRRFDTYMLGYREEYRESERKSDWVFERASDRKKYHQFTDAEWYQKKTLNKDCDGDNCEDLTEVAS